MIGYAPSGAAGCFLPTLVPRLNFPSQELRPVADSFVVCGLRWLDFVIH